MYTKHIESSTATVAWTVGCTVFCIHLTIQVCLWWCFAYDTESAFLPWLCLTIHIWVHVMLVYNLSSNICPEKHRLHLNFSRSVLPMCGCGTELLACGFRIPLCLSRLVIIQPTGCAALRHHIQLSNTALFCLLRQSAAEPVTQCHL